MDVDGNGTPDDCDVAQFYLADNGITVMCPDASVGDTGEVNGVTYTKRDEAVLDALVTAEDWSAMETLLVHQV